MPDFEVPDLGDEEMVAGPALDVPEVAIMRTVGGQTLYLPIARNEDGEVIPQTIFEACAANDVTVPQATQFLVDGQQVPGTTLIVDGMVITAVGNIKGG